MPFSKLPRSWILNSIIIGFLLLFGFITSSISPPNPTLTQAEYEREIILPAKVTEVISSEQQALGDNPLLRQVVNLEVLSGQRKGEQITEIGYQSNPHLATQLQENDKVLVGLIEDEFASYYYVIDHLRLPTVTWLAVLLLILMLAVLRKNTVPVLIAMGVSFYIVIQFMIPFIAQGYNPVIISFVALSIIIPASFYLVHGYQQKTSMAILGTLISLGFVSILAWITLSTTKLTGITNDDALTLFATYGQGIPLRSLLLAGILIGILGVLDDVTITQASIVQALTKKSKSSKKEIFNQAMSVGRDHIASAINTLILVYAGAALPTLILLMKFPRPLTVTLNDESIVIEIILALLGTIALIVAIPITTALSVYSESIRTYLRRKP